MLAMTFYSFFSITSIENISLIHLNLYLIEMPFKTFTNRANPDQAALVTAV